LTVPSNEQFLKVVSFALPTRPPTLLPDTLLVTEHEVACTFSTVAPKEALLTPAHPASIPAGVLIPVVSEQLLRLRFLTVPLRIPNMDVYL
jgi:hypothetical protein